MGNGWAAEILQRLTRHVYHDTEIPNVPTPTPKPPPKLLSAMRSLVTTSQDYWQSRSELFLKQARLMASYEDDYVYNGTVNQYFPTYDSLSDAQLRGYFTWRTAVRRGQIERRGMSYAFSTSMNSCISSGAGTRRTAMRSCVHSVRRIVPLIPRLHTILRIGKMSL